MFANSNSELPEASPVQNTWDVIRDRMWRSQVLRLRDDPRAEHEDESAFALLREMILEPFLKQRICPRKRLLEDQIVWSRSPVRLDLAGGWTDTPPYCLLHGGSVLNMAVELNGQPPIQVFAKLTPRREIILRSIDLGSEQRIQEYDQVAEFANPRSDFSLARAGLAIAGFLPRFLEGSNYRNLHEQLEDFGGGIEISMLAAVPQGSGLGTSSILAITLLRTLSALCGIQWTPEDLVCRTLALEQMVTTGGGWQDQAGGLLRGIKLLESAPGIAQKVHPKWLPEHLFSDGRANRSILLYYTGVTRLAKGILLEVVRGMFLSEARRDSILNQIGRNAVRCAESVQRADWDAVCQSVRESWELNQELDAGTNPPEIESILHPVWDYIQAAKLLGAGGGGYFLIFAKDEEAGGRIRRALMLNPPNDRARFVDFSISATGTATTLS